MFLFYCVTLSLPGSLGISGGQAQHGPISLMTSSELPAHVQYRFETPSVGVFGCVLFGWVFLWVSVYLSGRVCGVFLVVVGFFTADFPHWMRCSLFVESLPN